MEAGRMIAFVQDYGLWLALIGVFFAMHWFGMGCCGGHRHGALRAQQGAKPGRVDAGPPSGGCH
jgi:hypothetical protein